MSLLGQGQDVQIIWFSFNILKLKERNILTPHSLHRYSNISTYANPELRDFQILSIRLLFEKKENFEIGNVIEEVARQTNIVDDSVFVQELMDSHNQELRMDELTEMQEQEQLSL
ncbi:hypothetical protein TNCV_3389631 [Trichonephila clavipes]|nr:hypothetical protein TNCV_3389631 [Trichonephila clavipes]